MLRRKAHARNGRGSPRVPKRNDPRRHPKEPKKMLQGLQLMETAELNELAKITRLDAKAIESKDDDQLRRHILQWAGKTVGAPGTDPIVIETSCLRWLADHWGVDVNEIEDTDELERALRIRIADDASK